MVRVDDIFHIKYYDAQKNLMRNLQRQEQERMSIQEAKKEKINEIILLMAEFEYCMAGDIGKVIEKLEKFRDTEL